MGLIPTQTLGMRLSCNFVNVYTIVYHVQYTCTHTHPQQTSSRGKARIGQKSADKLAGSWQAERATRATAVGLQRRTRQAALTSARAGHANFRTRILARKSARKSVSVSVPWNLSLMPHQA